MSPRAHDLQVLRLRGECCVTSAITVLVPCHFQFVHIVVHLFASDPSVCLSYTLAHTPWRLLIVILLKAISLSLDTILAILRLLVGIAPIVRLSWAGH